MFTVQTTKLFAYIGSGKFHVSLGQQEIYFKPFSVIVCHLRDFHVPVAEMKAIQFLSHSALFLPLTLRCYTIFMPLATSMFMKDKPIRRKVKTSKAA